MAAAEREKLEAESKRIPMEVLNLTKSEQELRRDLCVMLHECGELKDSLHKELKRLRREHLSNLKDIEQIIIKFDHQALKLNSVCDRQGLNDQAMASVFKMMKLDHAMDTQDEIDRQRIYLMGLTNTEDTADMRLASLQKAAGQKLHPSPPPEPLPPTELIPHETANDPRKATGKFTQKIRASTTIPVEHSVEIVGNISKPINVISIDKTCQTCALSNQNEAVMKAFKMACLQYEPSPVDFENSKYTRSELIEAKNILLKYCLSQLKHLDLGAID